MIRINLLPPEERQSKWPVDRLLTIAGCLMAIIFSSLYVYTVFEVWNIEGKLQDTRNQYQLQQPTRTIMANANNKQQLVNNKNNIMTKLTQERGSMYSIIKHITDVTSPQIWFTEMNKSDKDMIKIKGWAKDYLDVAQFMQTMEQDQLLIESGLTNVEKNPTSQATTFEIVVKPRGI